MPVEARHGSGVAGTGVARVGEAARDVDLFFEAHQGDECAGLDVGVCPLAVAPCLCCASSAHAQCSRDVCCINSRVGYTGGETASAAAPMGASASKTDFIVEVYAPEKAPVKSENKEMKMKMTFNKKKKNFKKLQNVDKLADVNIHDPQRGEQMSCQATGTLLSGRELQ